MDKLLLRWRLNIKNWKTKMGFHNIGIYFTVFLRIQEDQPCCVLRGGNGKSEDIKNISMNKTLIKLRFWR